MNNESKKTILA